MVAWPNDRLNRVSIANQNPPEWFGHGRFSFVSLVPRNPGVVALHGSLNHQAMELFVAYLECTLFFAVIIILSDCFILLLHVHMEPTIHWI
jgi:hypothetical protein